MPNGTLFKTVKVFYQGCDVKSPYIFPIRGIYSDMEFYGMNDPKDQEHALQSTLFWQPGIVTTPDGTVQFSFFTGDISGEFKIIAQGMSKDDVVAIGKKFTVKQ